MAEDFYSFEKVLRELHLQEEELKKLVSEGEIRAFRDDDKMKFKKEDIERFKSSKTGRDLPTIESPSSELTEELFGDDALESLDEDVGMVTQQIPDSSFLEEDAGEIEPIELESAPESAPAGRGAGVRRRTQPSTGRTARRRVEGEEAPSEGTGMQVVLVLGAIALLYGAIVAFSAAQVQSSALTKGFADFVKSSFLN
ncbi:MAG: hypothetical protein HY812_05750 [Planctomycetes bacterium]|nr:hypothetical protein [Planctomycetota bacterium]